MFRIGYGYDVHRLVPGRKLILCGVELNHATGLLGHSDADVAVHALMDALLGALAQGDIGQWFPDHDPEYADSDSMKLLDKILDSPAFQGWALGNLDITIVAQKPKLASRLPAMRLRLAEAFHVPLDRISVKATTTEQLGFAGREEGIAASAVVLLQQVL